MQIVIIQSVAGFSRSGEAGGGEFHLHKLASQWKKLNNDIILFTNESDFGMDSYKKYDKIITLPTISSSGVEGVMTLKIYLQWIIQLRKVLKHLDVLRNVDNLIIIAGSPWASDIIISGILGRLLNRKCFVYFHFIYPPPFWYSVERGGIFITTTKWLHSRVSLSLAKFFGSTPILDHPSTFDSDFWGFGKQVLNDDDFLDSIPNSLAVRNKNIICFIAKNDPAKGIYDLPRIVNYLKDSIQDVKLIIGGSIPDGKIKSKLQEEIHRYGIEEYIEIRGFMKEEEKVDLLERSKIFVFPSYEDSWSLAVMEAASYCCLPVTYDLPAYDYLGSSSVKVQISDTRKMANIISELLSDEIKRQNIAIKAREAVIKYRLENIAQYQLEFFVRNADVEIKR